MKKLITVIIIAICSVVYAASQIEPTIEKSVKKLDEKTIEVTTTTTTVNVNTVKHDKAVLQTELDHMTDRKAAIQKQYDDGMAAANEREAELKELLAAFK